MHVYLIAVGVGVVIYLINYCCRGKRKTSDAHQTHVVKKKRVPSLLQMYRVRHVNAIVDQFRTLEEVSKAIRSAGLESSNLIFGVDFTASNIHQGERTFGGKSLHAIQNGVRNPYQQVISILGETLEPFDEDGIIPAFGFGDQSTKDRSVFPFRAEGYCRGIGDVLEAYSQIAQNVRLSGPTNFAPLIHQAIDIVKSTHQYHILVIIADGQVTSDRPTKDAIVEASKWPISIITIGVGDGPWEQMDDYDDNLPARNFDNFQFVDYNKVLTYGHVPQTTFALHALMELPDQYKQIRELGLLDF